MNIKIHKHPTTNRRAPLPSTDTGSLRSRTRRRYPHRDRSHHINATTNQKAPSRNTGGRNHSLHTQHRHESCLPIGRAISHPEVPIGRRKVHNPARRERTEAGAAKEGNKESEQNKITLRHELRNPHDPGNYSNDWLDQSAASLHASRIQPTAVPLILFGYGMEARFASHMPRYCHRSHRSLILVKNAINHYSLPTPPMQTIEATIVILTPLDHDQYRLLVFMYRRNPTSLPSLSILRILFKPAVTAFYSAILMPAYCLELQF
ncbi:hypothetical protein TNCV_5004261 [Trichonephila clavipes]|nr:hypothetical protein TNCV_5004261 [Trichonephila clavipes]